MNDDDEICNIAFTPREPKTEKHLAEIVIHWIAVLGALPEDKVFTPFKIIISKTSQAKVR